MLSMLLYYARDPGDPSRLIVVGTRDVRVIPMRVARELGLTVVELTGEGTPDDEALAVADFAAHEASGKPLRAYGVNGTALGAATWPEWLTHSDLAQMYLELEPGWDRMTDPRSRPAHALRALIHRDTGQRRERTHIEAAVGRRVAAAGDGAADIRDLVGGPDRPLHLTQGGTSSTGERRPTTG